MHWRTECLSQTFFCLFCYPVPRSAFASDGLDLLENYICAKLKLNINREWSDLTAQCAWHIFQLNGHIEHAWLARAHIFRICYIRLSDENMIENWKKKSCTKVIFWLSRFKSISRLGATNWINMLHLWTTNDARCGDSVITLPHIVRNMHCHSFWLFDRDIKCTLIPIAGSGLLFSRLLYNNIISLAIIIVYLHFVSHDCYSQTIRRLCCGAPAVSQWGDLVHKI